MDKATQDKLHALSAEDRVAEIKVQLHRAHIALTSGTINKDEACDALDRIAELTNSSDDAKKVAAKKEADAKKPAAGISGGTPLPQAGA